MSHPARALTLIALLALVCGACSGGGSKTGPTDPGPPAAPILGTWTGALQVVREDGSSVDCAVTFHFTQQQQQTYSGTYTVVCVGGQEDGGLAAGLAGNDMSFDAVIRTANSAHPPLDGCPWGGQMTQNGTRLFGNWEGGGCNGSTIVGGGIDISRTGG